jgi:DNA-binding protein YbaB
MMSDPGRRGISDGWLADLEQIEQDTREAQRAVATSTGTGEAADGLVEATVTGTGELSGLVLDPRVYREFGPEELAAEIRLAVNAAHDRAQLAAMEAFAAKLPKSAAADLDDVAFGPLLAELARMREDGQR